MKSKFYIGTAGWTIPSSLKHHFKDEGSHLERYARVFNCTEINSSFHREHKNETYVKWAAMVPQDFRFSVKLSKYFTQEERLRESGSPLSNVLKTISGLGDKWGALLVQLPPSLEFEGRVAERFIRNLRKYYSGVIVWEPRHVSWMASSAVEMMVEYNINKVLADPERCLTPRKERPRLEVIRYLRLHGAPVIYKSSYSQDVIKRIASSLVHPISSSDQSWCIFDNTTLGFATENALELSRAIKLN